MIDLNRVEYRVLLPSDEILRLTFDEMTKHVLSGKPMISHIGDDKIHGVRVSTILLLAASFQRDVFFETMIFGGRYNGMQLRYGESVAQAKAAHWGICEMVRRQHGGRVRPRRGSIRKLRARRAEERCR